MNEVHRLREVEVQKTKIAVIVNPKVSKERSLEKWREIKEGWGVIDLVFTEKFSSEPGEIEKLTRQAIKNGFNLITVVAGDGGINEAVNGFFENGKLISSEVALGMVGTGFGNDVVRTPKEVFQTENWRNPWNIEKVIRARERGEVKKIDLGQVTYQNFRGKEETRYFINIANVGLGAIVAEKVNKSSKSGLSSYLDVGLKTLPRFKPKMMEIKTDLPPEIPSRPKTLNISIANGRYFARGLLPAPKAKIDDGLFEVIVIGNFGILEALLNVNRIRKGSLLSHPKVLHFQCPELSILSDPPDLVEAEGEVFGRVPAHFKIHPRILNLAFWE